MSMSAIFGGIGRALGHRVYRLYWCGNSTAMVGRWMHRMAVGWLASFFGLPATIAGGALLAVVVWLWAHGAGRQLAAGLETVAPAP